MPRSLALLLTLACIAGAAARAGEVQVAVAANFARPLEAIGRDFTATTGHRLKITPGSTGKLYAQIVAGAPFEVLLAADEKTPARLVAEGQAVAGSSFTYAVGKLALWSLQPGLVDDQGAVLAGGKFAHLAIASPKLAPYGTAALEVLSARGLEQSLAPKLVRGESVAQTYQFVATGNAELGFVALSQLLTPGTAAVGSFWLVPPALYTPIRQDAVLLQPGRASVAARALLAWLKTEPARSVMEIYGYGH
jgi:molybdate transport system substrate-binding protein